MNFVLITTTFLSLADDIPNGTECSNLQWVTKWVDYSNKYGFGYQLSDHIVGVLFNNGTHMSLLADKKYVLCSLYHTIYHSYLSWRWFVLYWKVVPASDVKVNKVRDGIFVLSYSDFIYLSICLACILSFRSPTGVFGC